MASQERSYEYLYVLHQYSLGSRGHAWTRRKSADNLAVICLLAKFLPTTQWKTPSVALPLPGYLVSYACLMWEAISFNCFWLPRAYLQIYRSGVVHRAP